MKNSYEAYRLLGEDADSEDNLELPSSQARFSRLCSIKGVVSVLITVIFVSSLVVNTFLVYYIVQLRGQLETAGATQFGLSTVLYFTMSWLTSFQLVSLLTPRFRMNGILRTTARTKHSQMSSGRISNQISMPVLLR